MAFMLEVIEVKGEQTKMSDLVIVQPGQDDSEGEPINDWLDRTRKESQVESEGWSVSQKEAIRAKLQIVFNLGNNARDKSRIGLWHEHDVQRFEELLNEIEAITKGTTDE